MTSIVNYFGHNIIMNYIEDEGECAVNKAITKGRIWEPRIVKIYGQYINEESIVLDIGSHTYYTIFFIRKACLCI